MIGQNIYKNRGIRGNPGRLMTSPGLGRILSDYAEVREPAVAGDSVGWRIEGVAREWRKRRHTRQAEEGVGA